MKLRYRLSHLVAAIAVVALMLVVSKVIYESIVVPRTPIVWRPCLPADIVKTPPKGNAIYIVAGNGTISGSFFHVCHEIESSELRKLAYRHDFDCWHCDLTNTHDLLYEMEDSFGIADVYPPYVIVVRSGSPTICAMTNETLRFGTFAACVEKACR